MTSFIITGVGIISFFLALFASPYLWLLFIANWLFLCIPKLRKSIYSDFGPGMDAVYWVFYSVLGMIAFFALIGGHPKQAGLTVLICIIVGIYMAVLAHIEAKS